MHFGVQLNLECVIFNQKCASIEASKRNMFKFK